MPDHSTDFDSMNEDALQAALDDANARKDAARAEALALTKALDAKRSRGSLLAKLRAAGLSAAELALLGVPPAGAGDAVATPAPLDATAGAEPLA